MTVPCRYLLRLRAVFALSVAGLPGAALSGAPLPKTVTGFIENNCAECHDGDEKKGSLDLTAFAFDPANPRNFAQWVKIHDRAATGEMPPKKHERPPAQELAAFTQSLAAALNAAEQARVTSEGRATRRRLNRYEYENALRDLLHAPWLDVRDTLPEDGEASRFNKIGDALDISHVQMSRYLAAADYALRQVMATQIARPETTTKKYYAREQRSLTGPMKFSFFNSSPERATFPLLGLDPQPDVRSEKAPMTVGAADPLKREFEAVGVVASSYEPLEPKFAQFKAPVGGHYRIRLSAFSVWVGPGIPEKGKPDRWWIPDLDNVTVGRRPEPVTVYAETPPRRQRWLGAFDATPTPGVAEFDVWLLPGETIRPDAARLFRSRPGAGRWQNPLAEKDGQPGVAFRWLDVDGPIYDQWPTAGHKLLFGDLALRKPEKAGRAAPVEVVSARPRADAERLLRSFLAQAYRRPVAETDVPRFLAVFESAQKAGDNFADAMIAAYTAVLCSPEFLCLDEKPGRLDDYALAARLAFFLWNTAPDTELRTLATQGRLHQPKVLRAQTERLLNDPRSRQFVDAFLDYWLDLRRILATAPDSGLYPDYYLDDLLAESALEETQLFIGELLRSDLPARNLVASDFTLLNERLAVHYGLPKVEGVALRRVTLPPDSLRGGLMTQAAVLKVTANGTTTSPVLRGAWIMERLLGQPSPPPPPGVPAVEPDVRGTATIRQQLAAHRSEPTCASCHAKIDPPGFALESFDVMGGFRERYRAVGDAVPAEKGLGHGGQKLLYHFAQAVDCSGELADGRKFADVREFKQLLLTDEKQVARNLTQQLVTFSTGAPVRFGDRGAIEKILQNTSASHYGVRSLIREIVASDLFLNK